MCAASLTGLQMNVKINLYRTSPLGKRNHDTISSKGKEVTMSDTFQFLGQKEKKSHLQQNKQVILY